VPFWYLLFLDIYYFSLQNLIYKFNTKVYKKMSLKKFNNYLTEEYLQGDFYDKSGNKYKVYQLLYYAFDWDDNIFRMPTEIFLKDENGLEVGMNTEDFAHYRSQIGKINFEYSNHTIVGYANDPFRNFRDEVDPNIFYKDVRRAMMQGSFAKSYDKFIECLTTGSLFAIITARGHESGPNNNDGPMRKAIEFIISNLSSAQKLSMIDHLKMFSYLYDKSIDSDEVLISNYLDLCQFIGVSAPSRGGAPDNPEKAKEMAFRNFVSKCNDLAKELEVNLNNDIDTIKSREPWKVIAKIGFSDDDRKNWEHIDDVCRNLNNESYGNIGEFHVIFTGEKDERSVYKRESKISNFREFIKLLETSEQTPGLENSVISSTPFGNMSGQLNPTDRLTRQDDFHNQFLRQTDYLTKTSKEIMSQKMKEIKKRKKKRG
jgi:hypothetical protein